MSELWTALGDPLLRAPLITALLIGATAPIIGTFLVQRRMSLLGDGIGHVALTGVALGWLVGAVLGLVPRDVLALPGAVVAAVIGAVAIELVRERGRTSGDVALAMLFYGGIAGGVLIIEIAGGTNDNLVRYLFGSVATVDTANLLITVGLAALILVVGLGFRGALFAVSHDEEFARASGLPVRWLNILLAIISALTVTVAMRVVGVLMVSAMMIVPVATAQLLAASFRRTMTIAMAMGGVIAGIGLIATYWLDVSPGAAIVVLAIIIYAVIAAARAVMQRRAPRRSTTPPPPATPQEPVIAKEAT